METSTLRKITHHQVFWPLVALIALLVACGIFSPGFLSIRVEDGHFFGQLIDIARAASPPMLLAIGMTLVIATGGGGIDLSVGAVMALSLAVSLTYIADSGDPSLSTAMTALLVGLLVALVVGAFNGFMVTVLGIQPFIATLILMIAGRGIAMLVTKGQITTVTSPPFKSLGSGFFLGLPMPFIIAAAVFVVIAVVVRRSAIGMIIESIGINGEASRLAGIRSRGITWIVYAACGLLAGLAGMIYGAPTMAADSNNVGLMMEMDAIMCVVLGGTRLDGGKFSLFGSVVGAFILVTIERAVIIFHIASQITPLFKALVLIAVCIAGSRTLQEKLGLRRNRRLTRARSKQQDTAAEVTA